MTRNPTQVVIVVTTVTSLKESGKSMSHDTGFNAIEAGYAWKCLHKLRQEKNLTLTWASPRGGEAKMSPQSRKEAENDSELKEFFECRETAESLRNTKRIESISAEDVAAVVLIGGHGCLIDFPNSEVLHKLCSNVWYRSEGVLGAIAQGSVGLAYMKNDRGEPFLKNKKITCMSNEEEKSFKEELPFYVEEKMEQLGVQVENQQAFKPNVIVDSQRLITAQNPQSSRQFADKLHQTIRQYAEKV